MNYYSMWTNQYPQPHAKMQDTIVHWRNFAARYSLRAPPGAVIFAQDNNNNPASGEMHANDGQREPRDLSKVK